MRTARRNIDEGCMGSDQRGRYSSCGQWGCYGNHGGAGVGLVAPDRGNCAPGGTVVAWHRCHSQGGNVMIVEFKGWIEVDAEDVDSSWDLEQAIRDEGY